MIQMRYKIEYRTFGEFITAKRKEHEITAMQISEKLGLSPGYYCDIEKGRRYPPDRALLHQLSDALQLSTEDIHMFYDLAGKARDEAPPDLPEYINANKFVRVALRLAKDKGSADDWRRFITVLDSK